MRIFRPHTVQYKFYALSHLVPNRKIRRLQRMYAVCLPLLLCKLWARKSHKHAELVVPIYSLYNERNGAVRHTSHKTPPNPKQIYNFSVFSTGVCEFIVLVYVCVCSRANINATFIINYTPKVYLKTKN